MGKKPKQRSVPTAQKEARSSENPDTYKDKNICWQFGMMNLEDNFDWSWKNRLLVDKSNNIYNRLCNFETMKLSQVQNDINHFIKICDLNYKAKKILEKEKLNDYEGLHSFHIDGTTRFYCLPVGNIMKLLWYDPYHSNAQADRAVCLKKK